MMFTSVWKRRSTNPRITKPPKSAPSGGRNQENTYIYHSNRSRGGGLLPDPTGSFQGPRDRTQVISIRQKQLEEERKRREITEKEWNKMLNR